MKRSIIAALALGLAFGVASVGYADDAHHPEKQAKAKAKAAAKKPAKKPAGQAPPKKNTR